MHRFFVPPDAIREDQVILPDSAARQAREVLRLAPGALIAILDNSGAEYRVELTTVGREGVAGRLVERLDRSNEPSTHLVLYQSLLKADKFEWVLQKCTELGVARFVPVVSARTIASDVSRTKRARWERILIEAAEQSGRTRIPELDPVTPLIEALEQAYKRGGWALIPWEEERQIGLREVLKREGPIHLFIGPEGGFTAEEIEAARGLGVISITLGPRILRAETAGLVAATAIFYDRGELGGHSKK